MYYSLFSIYSDRWWDRKHSMDGWWWWWWWLVAGLNVLRRREATEDTPQPAGGLRGAAVFRSIKLRKEQIDWSIIGGNVGTWDIKKQERQDLVLGKLSCDGLTFHPSTIWWSPTAQQSWISPSSVNRIQWDGLVSSIITLLLRASSLANDKNPIKTRDVGISELILDSNYSS